jgi:hypothetical protein
MQKAASQHCPLSRTCSLGRRRVISVTQFPLERVDVPRFEA